MKEIKILGRGGQGAVTAAQVLATAAFLEGYWAQTFPRFGAERRGAPVTAYLRIDDQPIEIRNRIHSPDVVIVMDHNLFKMSDPLEGLKEKGTALINCPDKPEALPKEVLNRTGRLFTVDAYAISRAIYGKTAIPITNLVIAGAYCAAEQDFRLESIYKALPEFFPPDRVKANQTAVLKGFEHTRGVSWSVPRL